MGTRRCRFARSRQRSSTAPARSTATSHRRTRSSSRSQKRAFDCSAPRSSSTRRATTRSMTFARRPGVSTSSARQQPQYFALVFLDRRVPRIGREYERFAFMSELKSRLRAQMQRCIDEGIFPASVDADVGLRLIWAPILGIAALRLSERLPAEDADDLILDAIDTTIAGLRAGAPSRARPSTPFGSSSHSDVAHTS